MEKLYPWSWCCVDLGYIDMELYGKKDSIGFDTELCEVAVNRKHENAIRIDSIIQDLRE